MEELSPATIPGSNATLLAALLPPQLSMKMDHFFLDVESLFRDSPEQAWMLVGLLVLIWAGLGYLTFRYFPHIKYEILLLFKKVFGGGHRSKVLSILGDRDLPMAMLTEDTDGRKHYLCHTRFQYKKGDTLSLLVTRHRGLKEAAPGTEILCHFRPIRHMHLRINGFKSYITGRAKNKSGEPILKIKMPLSMGRFNCRYVKRIPVKDQRLIIAGIWLANPSEPSGATFMASPPAFMINDSRTAKIKGSDKVFDISLFGMRIGILKDLLLSDVVKKLAPDLPICIELRLYNRAKRNFDRHYLGGSLRHLFRGYRGMLVMGMEFTHAAEKKTTGGLPEFIWSRTERSKPFREFEESLRLLRG